MTGVAKVRVQVVTTIGFLANMICGLTAFPSSPLAQTESGETIAQFHEAITGKWARISKNAGQSFHENQVKAAAIQCHSIRKLNVVNVTRLSNVSKSVSRQLSRLIVYQKPDKGLKRIDFGTRTEILLPELKYTKLSSGRNRFDISNDRAKISITFARLKQGGKYAPVMVEGKALYLKCPDH